MFFNKIKKFRTSPGQMVDHEVKHQFVITGNILYVLPGTKGFIHLPVIDRCESPVSGGREEGQNMNGMNLPSEIPVYHSLHLF